MLPPNIKKFKIDFRLAITNFITLVRYFIVLKLRGIELHVNDSGSMIGMACYVPLGAFLEDPQSLLSIATCSVEATRYD